MEKAIKGYEGHYTVTDTGKVYSIKYGSKIMKPKMTNIGYPVVRLSKDGVGRTWCIHRLVAENFIPNPENKKTVNHISGDRCDNRVENLEWATYTENNHHALYVLGNIDKMSKPVECIETGVIYPSISEAARQLHLSDSKISLVCRGKRNKTGGYHWRYVKEKNA